MSTVIKKEMFIGHPTQQILSLHLEDSWISWSLGVPRLRITLWRWKTDLGIPLFLALLPRLSSPCPQAKLSRQKSNAMWYKMRWVEEMSLTWGSWKGRVHRQFWGLLWLGCFVCLWENIKRISVSAPSQESLQLTCPRCPTPPKQPVEINGGGHLSAKGENIPLDPGSFNTINQSWNLQNHQRHKWKRSPVFL